MRGQGQRGEGREDGGRGRGMEEGQWEAGEVVGGGGCQVRVEDPSGSSVFSIPSPGHSLQYSGVLSHSVNKATAKLFI